ncbi:MAG: hypothetical protein K9N34_06100 [Candidatus Marinimicrobia bacterium]|nr:hypothetical protein [Candidatus Neomarinimicrobiota bacterium]MCF7840204.1 hypothetical protein [Candidatus Neomarinimicrobiota bacterium]MCF7902569.1 hypothetical protein [Candidatus Neomarinimicrobiota bacterium]
MNEIAAEVLLQASILILMIGMALAIGVGLILMVKPALISQWNRKLNKWYSTRRAFRFLEVVHDTDPWFFKNHRIYGWLMLVVSLVLLYFMFFVSAPPETYDSLRTPLNHDQYLTLQFVYYFLLVVICISVPVWLLLIFAPHQLERIMPSMNQWISTRAMLRPVDEVNSRYDDFVLRHPRIFGTLFILGGVGGLLLILLR